MYYFKVVHVVLESILESAIRILVSVLSGQYSCTKFSTGTAVRTVVRLYSCTAQLYSCTAVPMGMAILNLVPGYSCTAVQLYGRTGVNLGFVVLWPDDLSIVASFAWVHLAPLGAQSLLLVFVAGSKRIYTYH